MTMTITTRRKKRKTVSASLSSRRSRRECNRLSIPITTLNPNGRGRGLKKAGELIALIGAALIVLLVLGFGAEGFASSMLVIFPLVMLPG